MFWSIRVDYKKRFLVVMEIYPNELDSWIEHVIILNGKILLAVDQVEPVITEPQSPYIGRVVPCSGGAWGGPPTMWTLRRALPIWDYLGNIFELKCMWGAILFNCQTCPFMKWIYWAHSMWLTALCWKKMVCVLFWVYKAFSSYWLLETVSQNATYNQPQAKLIWLRNAWKPLRKL